MNASVASRTDWHLRGEAPVLMMLTAVSLAVAAIPEALPAVELEKLLQRRRRIMNP